MIRTMLGMRLVTLFLAIALSAGAARAQPGKGKQDGNARDQQTTQQDRQRMRDDHRDRSRDRQRMTREERDKLRQDIQEANKQMRR
jgi:flagellar motility protein MotE (MotC chaperone)